MPHVAESGEPSGFIWMCLASIAGIMRFFFVSLPDFTVRMMPMAGGLLSGGFLYIFIQAIGLLWLFVVMLVSALLVKFVACSINSCVVDASPMSLARQMVGSFIHFCILRFLFHCGQNFWAIGWESFGDFPTFQRLISGPRPKANDPSHTGDGMSSPSKSSPSKHTGDGMSSPSKSSPSKHVQGLFHPVAIIARKIVLVAPGIFLLILHLGVVFSTAYCSSYAFWKVPVDDDSGPIWRYWASGNKGFCQGPIPDPTSRLNGAIRFAVYAGYLQWISASLRLFPNWHHALYINGHWVPIVLLFIFLPLSFVHIITVLPLFVGHERLHFITHHSWLEPYTVDNTMIAVCLLCVAIVDVTMLQPSTILLSGFDAGFMKGRRWHEFTMHLKYSFLCPVLCKFAWACFYPGMGFAEAQIDNIMITISYAGLLMSAWVTCFIAIDFPRKKRMILVNIVSFGVAVSLSIFARMDSFLIIIIVWGHLLRKQLPWFGSTKRLHVSSFTESGAHRYWTAIYRVGMSIMWGLVAVLLFLMLMSYIQDEIKWYPETIQMNVHDERTSSRTDVHEAHVAHTVSHLHMRTDLEQSRRRNASQAAMAPSGGRQGKYAICGQLFHGFSVLDYSLVALSAYWEPTSPDFFLMLQEFFPPWSAHPVSLKTVNHSRQGNMLNNRRGLYWVEYEVEEMNTRLIGIRGTDPTKIADFIEDIRLWTEPVAIQLLSFALPTVRLWPHGTIEGVIQGGHALLDFFGYTDNSWSYEDLLEHVERLRDQGTKVILTGHSMGGGLAMIVSALASVPAVAITPPGIYQSLSKHTHKRHKSKQCDISREDRPQTSVHYESLTLLVESDWVNGIFDTHGGLVQTMKCDRSDMGLQLQCHMLEGAICHIHRHCGDHRQRWDACRHDYTLHSTVWDVLRRATQEAIAKLTALLRGRMASLQILAIPILIILGGAFAHFA